LDDNPGIGEEVGLPGIFLVEFEFPGQAMFDVEVLRCARAIEQSFLVAEPERGEIGDARFVLQYRTLVPGIMLDVTGNFRSGPNEAHFPAKNIPELREFVEFGAAQDATKRGDTRIVIARNGWSK
jgi:hypothetical protein